MDIRERRRCTLQCGREMLALIEGGWKPEDIARLTGTSTGRVRQRLLDAGRQRMADQQRSELDLKREEWMEDEFFRRIAGRSPSSNGAN